MANISEDTRNFVEIQEHFIRSGNSHSYYTCFHLMLVETRCKRAEIEEQIKALVTLTTEIEIGEISTNYYNESYRDKSWKKFIQQVWI